MAENNQKKINFSLGLNRPTSCKNCGGIMVYKGVGEYRCEECGFLDYDDYGKVRNYLEHHKNANVARISEETGVSHKAIREMIKDNKFEVRDNRGGYIRCEMCGENINSGRLCSRCEMIYHKRLEDEERKNRIRDLAGYGMAQHLDEGHKRFTREK